MSDNHPQPARRTEAIRGYPGVFRILRWDETRKRYCDPRNIRGCRRKPFRAMRRVKVLGKWLQQNKAFDSVEEARLWRMEANRDLPEPRSAACTLRELVEEWRAWSRPPRYAQSTWEIYGKDLPHLAMLFDVPVEELSAADIDLWIRHCVDPRYPKQPKRCSFLRELKTLTTILNWYREYKNERYQLPILRRHRRDVFFKAKPGKPDISLSEKDLERFLEHLRTHQKPIYFYLASFQALSGARIGEACGLQWDCVDLEEATVEIKRICFWDFRTKEPHLREGTKTGDLRKVVIPERLVGILSEWKAGNGVGPLVFHNEGVLLRYPAIQNAYKKAYRACKLPVRSTHVLRHTFAAIYADQTGNVRAAGAALGHRDSRVTDHYAKMSLRTQRLAIDKFELGKVK